MATEISDLERRMLDCDMKCGEHELTQKAIRDLKHCGDSLKKRVDKITNKASWVTGLLFFVALLLGYCLNTMAGLNHLAVSQAADNQRFQAASQHVVELTMSQKNTEITLAQIQSDMKYMKRDLREIRKILKSQKVN